jgi:hypothetical protein
MKTPTKPTVGEVRQAHHLTWQHIADTAGVPTRVAYVLEIGGLVSKPEACKVIAALSHLTGEPYTLDSFETTTIHNHVQINTHRPKNQSMRATLQEQEEDR